MSPPGATPRREGFAVPVNAIIQAIAGTLYLATISTVGIRVLILARRNRGMPELLLGISLVVGGTFGASDK